MARSMERLVNINNIRLIETTNVTIGVTARLTVVYNAQTTETKEPSFFITDTITYEKYKTLNFMPGFRKLVNPVSNIHTINVFTYRTGTLLILSLTSAIRYNLVCYVSASHT